MAFDELLVKNLARRFTKPVNRLNCSNFKIIFQMFAVLHNKNIECL